MKPNIILPSKKEERDIAKLQKDGLRLHTPIPIVRITLEVTNKNKLIQKYETFSHSWVRNAYNHIVSQLMFINGSDAAFGAGFINAKDTSNTVRNAGGQLYNGSYNQDTEQVDATSTGVRSPAANALLGIQVGSGVNVESFEDYVLQALITEGVGAGQLNYAQSNAPVKAYVPGTLTYSVTWVRFMNNNSGGNVSVNEVALTANTRVLSLNAFPTLHSREHLGATVTIPNTGQLKVTYVLSLAFPA
ncbi:MAG: hypothetical protein V1767_01010 [Chloroflexota bacterium]